MSMEVMKMELENEVCCVCGSGGDLLTPEEHDAGASVQVPLRTMLLQLNSSKVVPDGRLCSSCIRRTVEAYEFSSTLSNKTNPPLSEKIRALRKRLHELTQKIDVFIVVGAAGDAGAYGEEDVVAVDRAALEAAAAADAELPQRARDARGDAVFQCSVCPRAFRRGAELRAHRAAHAPGATHSCWTCGAQFAAEGALRAHAAAHALGARACPLCGRALRRPEACACPARCPACPALAPFADRAALAAHAAAAHSRASGPPFVCPRCFRALDSAELLSAHLLRHRQARQFVCGYDSCILRFVTRSNLMAHIRKCHSGEAPEGPAPAAPAAPAPAPGAVQCHSCARVFGSAAAMKRHARVHRRRDVEDALREQLTMEEEEWTEMEMGGEGEMEGEVEYLEVEELEELEHKPSVADLL